ncbi:hypothetical protein KAR91_25255 [Candidatus Pacearchaeota archaeon]|nr:hypothetical protein [Candidatus Pacearchaeota archaeon]
MDSKGLRVKRILIVFALIGLVFSISVVKATPTQSVSVLYTALNETGWTEFAVPTGNYTAPYTVKLLPNFVWNATTQDAQFQLQMRNASDTYQSWMIHFFDGGTINGVYNGSIVGSCDFTMETEIEVKVATDGFTVNNGSAIQIEFFADFTMPIDGTWVHGQQEFTLTSGTVNMEFNDGGDYGVDIITSMIPLIVTIAVLGAVLKMFKKFDT